MFRYKNLLMTLIVILGIVATGCSSATETPAIALPTTEQATEAPAMTEVPAATEAPCIWAGHYAYLHCQSELGFRFRDRTG